MADPLEIAVHQELKKRAEKNRRDEVAKWCAFLDQASPRTKRRLKKGFIADVEVQPHRWFSAGLDILQSAHVTSRVQLMNGEQGEPMQSFLPYSVFQSGAEVFLKGMWLCQFPACRRVAHTSYVGPRLRRSVDRRLRDQGHDLLKLIGRLRRIRRYRADPTSMKFLARVSAIIRLFYFPLHQAGRGSWATARYPKRFYYDTAKAASADGFSSYPDQRLVLALFTHMSRHLDQLWNLRRGLLRRRQPTPVAPPSAQP